MRGHPQSAAPTAPSYGRGQDGARLVFDWSYALIESSSETFEQLIRGFENRIVTRDEIRNWMSLPKLLASDIDDGYTEGEGKCRSQQNGFGRFKTQ